MLRICIRLPANKFMTNSLIGDEIWESVGDLGVLFKCWGHAVANYVKQVILKRQLFRCLF